MFRPHLDGLAILVSERIDSGIARINRRNRWNEFHRITSYAPATPLLKTMSMFAKKSLPVVPDLMAPDGSAVRILLAMRGGSMAHFELTAGKTSLAVVHRTVEEIWYVLSGRGEMWRAEGDREETAILEAGICLTIPVGTRFQFRASATEGLCAVAITMPPWPGPEEAQYVAGPW